MLRAVTAPLVGEYVAFQPDVMFCPPGSVKASVQPLMAVLPVLVIVMFDVRPVFQALIVSLIRHAAPPGGGDDVRDGDGDVFGVVGGGLVGVVLFNPKNAIVYAAMPPTRALCDPPWTLIASTGACVVFAPYRVRVQELCGESLETGVWLTPRT